MSENSPRKTLLDALLSSPHEVSAQGVRTRITVLLKWAEIEEAVAAGFPLKSVWRALNESGDPVGSYQTFCREVSRRAERQRISAGQSAGSMSAVPRGPQPSAPRSSTIAEPQPADAISPSVDGVSASPDDALAPTPKAASSPLSPALQREKDRGRDDYYFRPKTPEERTRRKEEARARVAAREAAEAASIKQGEPE